jgi:Ca-activated chloride channel family protein
VLHAARLGTCVALSVAAAASLLAAPQAPSDIASGVHTAQPPAFKAGIDLVNFGVTVTDKRGALVTDLAADDFEIYEDGKRQAVSYFSLGDPDDGRLEMHLGLMLDVSDSMEDDLPFTKTAAVKFLNMLTDAADITVVDFDSEVRVARYSQAEFARLIERIRQKKVSGETAIYDAVGVYLDGAGGQNGRKIMLLYTDGGDTSSSMALHELIDLLKASDVTVYVIGELEHQPFSVKNQQRMVMLQIAEVTGGQAFFPTSVKQLDEVYAKVLAQIRAQYILGYVSTNAKTDGTWRKVEVRLARKDDRGLRTRSRKGYFATYKP